MFDLEQAVAEWRKEMLAAGIKTPVPLEELESHLREEIGRQLKSGLNSQSALEIAIQAVGQADVLESEFKKNEPKRKSAILTAATLGLGVAFVVLGIFSGQAHKTLTAGNALEVLGGSILAIAAGRDLICVIKPHPCTKTPPA